MAKKESVSVEDTCLTLEAGVYALSVDPPHVFWFPEEDSSPVRRSRLVVVEDRDVTVRHFPGTKLRIKQLRLDDAVDPVPHEAMLTEPRPLTLQEQIARFVGEQLRQRDDSVETFAESDDFDLDDDDYYDPVSAYIVPEAEPELPPSAKAPVKPSAATSGEAKPVDSPPADRST